jgi:hypothetical protein
MTGTLKIIGKNHAKNHQHICHEQINPFECGHSKNSFFLFVVLVLKGLVVGFHKNQILGSKGICFVSFKLSGQAAGCGLSPASVPALDVGREK